MIGPLDVLLAGPRAVAGVVGAVQALPVIVARLEEVAEATACLPRLHEDMQRVAEDTAGLTALAALDGVNRSTEQIAGAMPVLIDLQDELPAIVPLMKELLAPMERLSVSLEALEQSTDRLAHATGPLGRLADRLPRRAPSLER